MSPWNSVGPSTETSISGSRAIGPALVVVLAEGAARRRLEGQVRRVDGVDVAVLEHHRQPLHRIPDVGALLEHRPEALLDGRDVLGGDRAADHLVLELELARRPCGSK